MREVSSDEGTVLFGRDLTKTPCMRTSFLYGISGGLGVGVARFMFTSKPKSGANFAVGSFALITISYWFQCRYKYSRAKFELERVKYSTKKHAALEGTEIDKEIKKQANIENVDTK